ncbi:MAG: hypothetical protein ACI4E1_03990 [Lachnospira sp.]
MSIKKVKYMAELFLKQMAYVIFGSFAVSLYWYFIGDNISLAEIKNQCPNVITLMGVFALTIYSLNYALGYFQNHVSLGATRKSAITDMIILEALVMVSTYLITMLVSFGKNPIHPLAVLMFGMGTGFLLGILLLCLGRKGYYIFIVACLLCGFMVAFVLLPSSISFKVKINDALLLFVCFVYALAGIATFTLSARKKSISI